MCGEKRQALIGSSIAENNTAFTENLKGTLHNFSLKQIHWDIREGTFLLFYLERMRTVINSDLK